MRTILLTGLVATLAITLMLACAGERDAGQALDAPPIDADLTRLAGWLTGSFSSSAQARRDADFFDIRIHATRVWSDRTDGVWIYIEQAAASALDKPYRQRVYHVTRVADDLFQSRVFSLEEPLRFVGAWRDVQLLDGVAPEQLSVRDGCAVILRKLDNGEFAGSTLGRLCTSTLRGATYATSEVTVRADGLLSWDRGFNATGEQVWGAENGPYDFDRLGDGPAD
jgi:hypothetical protein